MQKKFLMHRWRLDRPADRQTLQRVVHWLVVFALLVPALLPLQPVAAQSNTPSTIDRVADDHELLTATLQADQAPAPGEVATLTLQVSPTLAATDLSVEWILTDGGELLGTTSEHFATVGARQSVQSVRQIRFPGEGVYRVNALARYQPQGGMTTTVLAVLFFTSKNGGGSVVSDRDPATANPRNELMITTFETPTDVTAAATEHELCFRVSGRVQRVERTATQSGYSDDVLVPVINAPVELLDEDVIWDDSYGTTKTDAMGNYTFAEFCRDSWFEEALDLYIEVTAERYTANERAVYVVDDTYIDEPYVFQSSVRDDVEGGSPVINLTMTERSSAVFNIVDAAFEARRFWEASGGAADGSKTFDYETEIYWNPNDGEAGSYYDPVNGEITIADDPSSPDEWDDSVIMHEWAHMADDKYSCDDSPGGEHFVDKVVDDPELAWGEGYPDYYQSAVRAALGVVDNNFYLDNFGLQVLGPDIVVNLESWDTDNSDLVSEMSEFAVAALLWDLRDNGADNADTVEYGHSTLQEVYTSDTFTSNGVVDDTCEVSQYLKAWRDLKKPTDGATAATVTQNVGGDEPFALVASSASQDVALASNVLAGSAKPVDYQWWRQVVMVADRSKSMEGAKFNAVKSVLTEQVNDLAPSPKGVAFSVETFDNTSTVNQGVVNNKFFASQVTPAINALTTNSATDSTCPVGSIRAMTNAIGKHMKGDLWLFTDGDPSQANVETLVQTLNRQQLKGSIALLGGCSAVPVNPLNTTGATKNYLGLAADASQSAGIVPYLLTAIGSGGQFLFVDAGKTSEAAEILQAQLSHSAGAGRWSDYVSDGATYRYDKLPSWEYQWIDTSIAAGGALQGTPKNQVTVTLPKPFPFYSVAQDKAHVSRYGYLTFGAAQQADQAVNTPLPSLAVPNAALYPLWGDLFWRDTPNLVSAAGATGVDATTALEAYVFTRQSGDWFVIETNGIASVDGQSRAYQVLLNTTTGEIRYQYKNLTVEAGIATIGLENSTGTSAVQIGHKDSNAASSNMGYKFLPAPAQPSKTFTVAVDSLVNSVGFLLTGFSGDFDPLTVRTPNGAVVSCADSANVRCFNVGLVQYVEVKVNGRVGNWVATVSAGPNGAGTFSFSTIGASPVNAVSPSNRALPTSAQPIAVNLAISTTGNMVDGWWQRPDGSRKGSAFKLYDDGTHNDGRAGDGEFGSDAIAPAEAGVAYLWIKGNANGVDFVRNDPAPFNFQPLEVTSLGDGVNLGGTTALVFSIKNSDSVNHCYDRTTQVPEGWVYDWQMSPSEQTLGLCISAGATVTRSLQVRMSNAPTNNFPSGASGQVTVFFVEKEEGQISGGASAEVKRYRPAAAIHFNESASATYLRPNNSDTQALAVLVVDDQGKQVADGTVVQFSSTLGSVLPTSGPTQNGQVDLQLKAGTTTGAAIVTAMIDSIVATTTVMIQNPLPNDFNLVAEQSSLAAGVETTVISATVRDAWGNPLPNQLVRIGVSEDGFAGSMNGSEVMTGTTSAAGVVTAVYDRTPLPPAQTAAANAMTVATQRTAIIRAELLLAENGSFRVIKQDAIALTVFETDPSGQQQLFLPLVMR